MGQVARRSAVLANVPPGSSSSLPRPLAILLAAREGRDLVRDGDLPRPSSSDCCGRAGTGRAPRRRIPISVWRLCAADFFFGFSLRVPTQIIAGNLLLVHEDKVYRVNAWINSHPGGEQLLLHFIGRDVRLVSLSFPSLGPLAPN